jgi:hypothetical protein
MFQQLIALIIIVFFLARLFMQKKKKQVSANEFYFWLIFWVLAAAAIVFIKRIDSLVARFGFSGTGIEVLFYVGVIMLFYLIFRLRLRMERIERDITEIVKNSAINNPSSFLNNNDKPRAPRGGG